MRERPRWINRLTPAASDRRDGPSGASPERVRPNWGEYASRVLQALFFLIIVRPVIVIVIGLIVHSRERLPLKGPAIIAPNHNSHLDTLTLMSLWPLLKLHRVRPAAAADYFLRNRALAWISLNLIRIIPVDRQRKDEESDPLRDMDAALQRGEILLIFPEGSRGAPEQISRFKTGVARLVERHPEVPIIPVFTHGLGKSLPRGTFLLVPFFADIVIGEPVYWAGSVEATMAAYQSAMEKLAKELKIPAWD